MNSLKRKQDATEEAVSLRAWLRTSKKAKPDAPDIVDSDANADAQEPHSSSSTTFDLPALLDLSSLHDESAISDRFDEIARVLMHGYHLVVSREQVETVFQIQEMEFYLQKAQCHEDPFTHGSEEQKVSGRWYFHRAPRPSHDASRSFTSLTAYRDGSRKGLDLTMGGPLPPSISRYFTQSARSDGAEQEKDNQNEDGGRLRGGILLRSLREVPMNALSSIDKSKAKMVHGPSLLVDKILELSGASSISDLVEELWGGDTDAFVPQSSSRKSHLYFRRTTDSQTKLPQIHKSPRIGLDLSHSGVKAPTSQTKFKDLHSRIRFLPKMYRYMTRPEQLSKGRAQTFYGCLHTTLGAQFDIPDRTLSGNTKLRATLASTVGMKDNAVKKYLAEYEAGRGGGLERLQRYIGSNGKGMAVSPTSYLAMMGALDTVVANALKIENESPEET